MKRAIEHTVGQIVFDPKTEERYRVVLNPQPPTCFKCAFYDKEVAKQFPSRAYWCNAPYDVACRSYGRQDNADIIFEKVVEEVTPPTCTGTCSNCVYYSDAMLACFHPANEGRRVFNPTADTCDHWEELALESPNN